MVMLILENTLIWNSAESLEIKFVFVDTPTQVSAFHKMPKLPLATNVLANNVHLFLYIVIYTQKPKLPYRRAYSKKIVAV